MKELKVGNYIRTKDKKGVQYIRKIIDLPKDTRYGSIVVDKDIHNVKWVSKKNVLKVSENIIDLIDPGDVLEINNEKYEVIYDESYKKLGILIPDKKELAITHSSLDYIFEKYKVSVVTKEQFDSVRYEVEK